jgi:hypothetical protein
MKKLYRRSYIDASYPNLAGSIYVRSSIKFLRFIPFGQQIWLPRAILVSDWLMLNKSSLKLLGQIKPNLVGSKMEPYEEALYRVSYIDASCQVWFHLAKEFQGRRFV